MNQVNNRPRVINWLGYLAITLLLTLPVAVLMVRAGVWQQGLMLYAISCLACVLLLLLAAVLMLLPRFAPWRKDLGFTALMALPGTLLLLSVLGGSGDYPAIHDITTDISDPPLFTAAQQQRGDDANPLELDEAVMASQQQAYPDLQTLVTDLPIDDAFDRAIEVATNMGWDIYHQDRNAGVIEAVETTRVMGFKDDVVIRVRSNAAGSLLDLRSVSRVGKGDIGANAKRIRAFQQQFSQ
jgi:uncharacterized protein (DUF1499 family)